MCYFWLGKYGEAVNCFRKMKTPDRESVFYLTASLSKLGEGIKSSETSLFKGRSFIPFIPFLSLTCFANSKVLVCMSEENLEGGSI